MVAWTSVGWEKYQPRVPIADVDRMDAQVLRRLNRCLNVNLGSLSMEQFLKVFFGFFGFSDSHGVPNGQGSSVETTDIDKSSNS